MAGFFGFIDYDRPGPGISKNAPEKNGLARYFDILGNRFWKMVTLNFVYFIFSIIPLIIMWGVVTSSMTWTLALRMTNEEMTKWFNEGGTLMLLVMTLMIYCCFGGGASACGFCNVLRNYVDGKHAWVWQDFWAAFKRTFFRGTLAYAIDCLSVGVLIMNFGFYNTQADGIMTILLRSLLIMVIVIWGMMHVYIYPTMASFDFKLWDVYRNSFVMVIGKLLHTAAAFLLGIVISFAVIYLSMGIIYLALFIPIFLFALHEYTRLSISYPLIKKYMAKPQPEGEYSAEGEALFSDDRVDQR